MCRSTLNLTNRFERKATGLDVYRETPWTPAADTVISVCGIGAVAPTAFSNDTGVFRITLLEMLQPA